MCLRSGRGGGGKTNNWKTPNKQNPTTHNWGCCESVPELSWPQHWALSVHLTIPSPADSADRCVHGRRLRFGCPLLLPPTRFASHCTWVLEGAFGKEATGVFKICEAGNTEVLRCTWCNLKIFCIYAFAILIWNEVTEMKWFSAEAGKAVGVVEKMNEVYSEQTDTFKPGAQYKLMPWVHCRVIRGEIVSNNFLAILNSRHWNYCCYLKYLTLRRLRLLPGTAVRKGKKSMKSVREKGLLLAQLLK